jgi:hypothetical protein
MTSRARKAFNPVKLAIVVLVFAAVLTVAITTLRQLEHQKLQALADSDPSNVFAFQCEARMEMVSDQKELVLFCEITNLTAYELKFRGYLGRFLAWSGPFEDPPRYLWRSVLKYVLIEEDGIEGPNEERSEELESHYTRTLVPEIELPPRAKTTFHLLYRSDYYTSRREKPKGGEAMIGKVGMKPADSRGGRKWLQSNRFDFIYPRSADKAE